ncbi:MAG: DUF4258 domain-containing protein [Dehalococcoidia bacterium]|nr:MAG: DUF4258 domain-containing protein [Dehalococcoidia bacterium]
MAEYAPHAELQMALRGISKAEVEFVLTNYHTSRPAPRLRNSPAAVIFIGDVSGRTLKVYVEVGTSPPLVKTTVWEG